ncbi:MAG: hypothetical protein GY842_22415 [bacterium]|nr:hypothetical protein [bacterium]
MVSRRAIIILSLLIVGAGVVAACSEETRYRTLRFFFDGVPDPGAPPPPRGYPARVPPTGTPEVAETPKRKPSGKTIWSHAPFRDNKCGDCHRARSGSVPTAQEGLCARCHRDIPGDPPYVHGPVAVNDCSACHHHHSSVYPKLLLDERSALCARCHRREDLTAGRYHAADGEQACVDCHDPHAGDNPFLLKLRTDWGTYVHGPVAVGDCAFCHRGQAPVDSASALSPRTALCLRCHQRADLTEGLHHGAKDEQDCTTCHDPHGGENVYFLKQDVR